MIFKPYWNVVLGKDQRYHLLAADKLASDCTKDLTGYVQADPVPPRRQRTMTAQSLTDENTCAKSLRLIAQDQAKLKQWG